MTRTLAVIALKTLAVASLIRPLAADPLLPPPAVSSDPEHPFSSVPGETKAERDLRMAWWRDAKFGMFIHWGVYSVPAGFYQGKPVAGNGEWIMSRGKIPVKEYRKFAPLFTAEKFDAAKFVNAAKSAGMRYIVITTKHHDGFAMFDSRVNDWTITRATPFKRDPVKELSLACPKHDVKFGTYYSVISDWGHPGGGCGGRASVAGGSGARSVAWPRRGAHPRSLMCVNALR